METADISLHYWNPRFPTDIKTIKYNQERFNKDKKNLIDKIKEIKRLNYEEYIGINKESICKYCEYRSICFLKKPELVEIEEM